MIAAVLGMAGTSPAWPCDVIAHAGGAIGGVTYTNSYEALAESKRHGARVVELDMAPSSDGYWHCVHDLTELGAIRLPRWLASARMARGTDRFLLQWGSKHVDHFDWVAGLLPSDAEMRAAAERERSVNGRQRCELRELAARLDRDGGPSVVLDTKYWTSRLLRAAAATGSVHWIPQVYSQAQFVEARSLGFTRIIFSLYKQGDYDGVDVVAADPSLWAVTLPVAWMARARSDPRHPTHALADFTGRIYVHPVDPSTRIDPSWRVSGVYASDVVHATRRGAGCVSSVEMAR